MTKRVKLTIFHHLAFWFSLQGLVLGYYYNCLLLKRFHYKYQIFNRYLIKLLQVLSLQHCQHSQVATSYIN